jgi:hypothetical protein
MKNRFGVLRTLSTILKIIGVVIAALAVLGGLAFFIMSIAGGDLFTSLGFDETSGAFFGLFGAFGVLIGGLLYALLIYGFGELVMLLISIEDNTYRTVTLLEDVTKEEK